jgi:hypothetical protein
MRGRSARWESRSATAGVGDVNGSRDGEQLASSGDLNARAGLLPSPHRLGTARVTSLLHTGRTSSVTPLGWYKLYKKDRKNVTKT